VRTSIGHETIGPIVFDQAGQGAKAGLSASGLPSTGDGFVRAIACCSPGRRNLGINIPVAWDLRSSFSFLVDGIGHAGTSSRAILLLLHQKWRTSINRFRGDDALCRGLRGDVPVCFISAGPWVFFWLVPYPDTWGCGRSFAVRWSGMFSPSATYFRFP